MANILRIKRRASGLAGAPGSLENAELAFNEVDNTLYYGKGTGGVGGSATTVEAIAGPGAYLTLSTAQTVTGIKTFTQTIVGNIDTADKLKTSRTISLSGDATWSVSFDGSANSTAALTLANTGVTTGSYGSASKIPTFTVDSKGRLTAAGQVDVATNLSISGNSGTDTVSLLSDTLAFLGTNGLSAAVTNNTVTFTSNATNANTASTIVSRDASGNFSAGTITAALSGNATTASTLQTARTITLNGDLGGSVSFNGGADVTLTATIQPNSVALGTDTTGNYIATIAGTANQVAVSGSGSETAAVTLSLPQDIHTGATPTFTGINVNNAKITNLANPTADSDAANKGYVDSVVQGLSPKQSVKAASTTNIASLSGPMTIDGVALVAGDRVLVKDQTTASQNGIYEVSATAWSRAADANTWAELISAFTFVEQGTVNAENGFLSTVDVGGTLGTSAVTFVQFSGAGQIIAGAGLTKTGNQLDVAAGTGISVAADNVALTGQALALHNLGTNGFFVRTAAATVAARSIAVNSTGLNIANGDGVSGNPTITLNASLASVGGLTPAADRLAYYTGATTAALTTFTAYARTLLDDADAATARTTLGLGSMAVQNSNTVSITGGTIDGITFDGGTF